MFVFLVEFSECFAFVVEIKNAFCVRKHFLLQRKAGITITDKARAIRSYLFKIIAASLAK
jgi:hypothetical protein